MHLIRCTLLAIRRINQNEFTALVIRHDNHPLLGPPNGRQTQTSRLLHVNFNKGWLVTENNLYDFSGDFK